MHLCSAISVRRPIGSRPPSDQIAYGARSDCVRCPIGLRSVSDQIAFGGSGKGWGFIMNYFGLLYILVTFVHIIV